MFGGRHLRVSSVEQIDLVCEKIRHALVSGNKQRAKEILDQFHVEKLEVHPSTHPSVVLSVRLSKALEEMGITTLHQLANLDPEKVPHNTQFGPRSIEAICRALESHNIRLGSKLKVWRGMLDDFTSMRRRMKTSE